MNLKRHRPKPKLERRNAAKNIDYEPRTSSSWSPSWSISSSRYFSLDGETRFRLQGAGEGEFHRICRSLGLSGPEDFAIPPDEWEAQKNKRNQDLADEFGVSLRVRDESASEMGDIAGVRTAAAAGGEERLRLTWGIGNRGSVAMERDGEEKGGTAIGCDGGIWELSGLCSFSTSNEGGEDDDDDDDDSWSTTTTTEGMCVVSPEGSFRRNIVSWSRGELLGRGSFGKVYEGISE